MKLVHLHMRRPDADVSLFDGSQFNVAGGPYQEHIVNAPERQEVFYHLTSILQSN